jgi:hypothetical protein
LSLFLNRILGRSFFWPTLTCFDPEVSAHSLVKGKIDLGCVGGCNSFKLQIILTPFENLEIESTLPNSITLIQSVEGVDWIVLQPKSFPSKNLSTNK